MTRTHTRAHTRTHTHTHTHTHTQNDILHEMMGSGVLQKKAAVVPTVAPAMDIQARGWT